jgi:hypothetical protein
MILPLSDMGIMKLDRWKYVYIYSWNISVSASPFEAETDNKELERHKSSWNVKFLNQ